MIKRYKENETEELAQILKNDGVISVPTDTVYGICARINSVKAYNNLVAIKNRPNTKLFSIMCADKEQIERIAIIDEKTRKLIEILMPGPITLILNKRSEISDYINNGSTTIAVRMATSKVLEELIQKIGSPIFMTSANKSGESVCTTLEEIEEKCPTLDGMLEGKVSFNQASTILDCTSNEIRIIRNGPISLERILEIIGS